MKRTRLVRRGGLCLAVLAALAGCGGSGSSGFDASPLEGMLIEQAIEEGRCVAGDGALTICPSGGVAPVPSGGMPAPGDLRVALALDPAALVDCVGAASQCRLTVDVAVEGLPPGTEIRLAFRVLPDVVWSVGPARPVQTSSDGAAVLAPQTIDLGVDADPAQEVQVAVLVFLPPAQASPSEVNELRETGADYAFVAAPEPIASPVTTSASP